mmetsp:Transcript_42768/g.101922  ORF Transcript_42768/g.101922 Transcript_42768/m.101922 type:complete len:211 (+) Transcript_42768:1632-2264(+)
MHFLEDGLALLRIPGIHAHVQHGVVHRRIHRGGLLQLPQESNGTWHVPLLTCGSNQPHVVLHVAALGLVRRSIEQALGEVLAAALHRKLHQAAVHDAVWGDAVGQDVVVQIAGAAQQVAGGEDLHQCLVGGERGHLAIPEVALYHLSQADMVGLPAAGQHQPAEALGEEHLPLLHLLQQADGGLLVVLGRQLQQRLQHREGHLPLLTETL